ncbi:PepSY domain-containing protein [Aequorivita sp. Q41]|uniref:PepSY domain-containing protein n=1 Tax=Aequorivita sp. Q41 TaxID=3153300 RepID=UPI0032425DEF
MTISIWRYSHLALAVVSSLFLIVASVTGIILAVEPITHQSKGFAVQNLEEVSLATTMEAIKENYDEVFSLEIEPSGFVKASVLTEDFETRDIYINPSTAQNLGEVSKRPEIYSFATNLHRSLFLKSIGRFFVGLVSFLLFIIASTGIFLLAKRQGGLKKFFSKVQKEYFEMRYHVILSRILFIPILIIALTGVYLSAEKFDLLPEATPKTQNTPISKESQTFENLSEIPFFKETMLSKVRKVDFPFSEAPEDYFHIALQDKEVQLNQQTGTIVRSNSYPFIVFASRLSMTLHTGEGNVVWSIILLIASASILFFMYSGFVMTLKRRKKVSATPKMPHKDECEFIILVGSETGTTFAFATRLYNALTLAKKQVYLSELNNYTTYAKAKHLIVLTATYGEGEAPTNARKFETILQTIQQPNKISYAVIGFGSLEYPDYCQFAINVDILLQEKTNFQGVLPLYKINNANFTDFKKWVVKWTEKTNVPLKIEPPKQKKTLHKIPLKVIQRTALNSDNTFLLRLKPKRKTTFTSGDLLAVFPNNSDIARQYSIARIGDEIVLSIKKHAFGRGSSYLYNLKEGAVFKAAIETNPTFHFPKKTKNAVLISNGTGIAPFLGMVNENSNATINLLWGGRSINSAQIYDAILDAENLKTHDITILKCFSREKNKQYVQDLVIQQSDAILKTIANGGVLMLCGSLAMQHGVLDVLEQLLKEKSNKTLDVLIHNGQLKMDCY